MATAVMAAPVAPNSNQGFSSTFLTLLFLLAVAVVACLPRNAVVQSPCLLWTKEGGGNEKEE